MQASDIQQTVDKAVDKALARELQPAVDKAVKTAMQDAMKNVIEPSMDKRIAEWEARFDKRAIKIAEDAANFVYEKQKHDFGLVLEATDFIKQRLDDIPTRNEFNDLKSEVRVIRHAVTATNQDLKRHDKRITDLENEVFYD